MQEVADQQRANEHPNDPTTKRAIEHSRNISRDDWLGMIRPAAAAIRYEPRAVCSAWACELANVEPPFGSNRLRVGIQTCKQSVV